MKKPVALTLIALFGGLSPAGAETLGTYLRDGVEPILVRIQDGLLYCTRISDGFEICNGMEPQGENAWHGNRLKNPDMPRFVSARGTITLSVNEMGLEGCVMGGAVCKSQIWPVQN